MQSLFFFHMISKILCVHVSFPLEIKCASIGIFCSLRPFTYYSMCSHSGHVYSESVVEGVGLVRENSGL